jgi:hypothetical protein
MKFCQPFFIYLVLVCLVIGNSASAAKPTGLFMAFRAGAAVVLHGASAGGKAGVLNGEKSEH